MNAKQLYEKMINKIYVDKGFDFSGYKENTIKRRIERRISATGANGYEEYIAILNSSEEEYSKLISDLTIKVSIFFRNPLIFEMIFHIVLPRLFQEKEKSSDNTLRIWCAGSAHGEEAYSMAILLIEYQEKENVIGKDVEIFGTDVDQNALKKARKGIYPESSLYLTKLGFIKKYFCRIDEKNFTLNDSVKNMVTFSYHNLLSDTILAPQESVFANFDIILCRNVLIYFSRHLQDKVFFRFHKVLNKGGYLVLGESETLSSFIQPKMSELLNKSKVFKKE